MCTQSAMNLFFFLTFLNIFTASNRHVDVMHKSWCAVLVAQIGLRCQAHKIPFGVSKMPRKTKTSVFEIGVSIKIFCFRTAFRTRSSEAGTLMVPEGRGGVLVGGGGCW